MSRVKVDIVADSSKFKEGMEGVKSSVEGIKHLIEAAFVVDALKELIGKTFEYSDAIVTTSEKLRLNTDEVQALSIAAQNAGTSLETISKGYEKIELAKAKALLGDKEAMDNLKKAGAKDLKETTLQMFGDIASNAAKGTDQSRVGMAGLGLKSVAGDLALLGDNAIITKQKIDELKENGLIVSESDIAKLREAKVQMQVVGQELTTILAPLLAKIAPIVLLGIKDIIDNFKLLFEAIVKMAKVVTQYIDDFKKAPGKTAWNLEKEYLENLNSGTWKSLPPLAAGSALWDQLQASATKHGGDTPDSIVDEMTEKMIEADGKNADDLDRSIAAILKQLSKSDEPVDETAKPKELKKSIYSDELTRSGNFLGANLGHAAQAATQLDIQKRQVDRLDKIHISIEDQKSLLEKIRDNTASSLIGDKIDNEMDWL